MTVDAAALADAGPDAAPPDATPIDVDASPSSGFFVHDEAEDFAAGTLTEAVVDARGAITPVAYHTGGLRVVAADGQFFTDGTTALWADVEAMTMTGRGSVARALAADYVAGTPQGVGLASPDNWTMAYDGEIYLDAGAWTFYLLADDHAFLDLASPGTASFTRVASANWSTEATAAYTVVAAGWHPIRIAHAEQAGNALLRVEAAAPGGARAPLSRHRLRFRADALRGLTVTAYDDARLLGPHAASLHDSGLVDVDWGDGAPADLGLADADWFSVRWAGQLWIEVAGDYAFRYVSDDGQRLWIDGQPVFADWDDTVHDNVSVAVPLARGWHAVVADHSEASGGARASLTINSGPEGAGSPLALDRLRPVVARSERVDGGLDRTDRAIPDLGSVDVPIVVDAPIGAVVRGIDVSWTFTHTYWGDLEVRVIPPDGTAVVLRDDAGGSTSGTTTDRVFSTAVDGVAARGAWIVRITDDASVDTGTLLDVQLTVHYDGGEPPVPALATFDSAVVDLGADVTGYELLTWDQLVPGGAGVLVRARAGDTEADCLAAAWSLPMVNPGGSVPDVTARRYFQYRIELTSTGDAGAAVDWVRLDYARGQP